MMFHPDRARVLAELHARPFTPVATPSRWLHFAFHTSAADADQDRAHVDAMADTSRPGNQLEDKRHLILGDGTLRWERHGEFVSYTIATPLDAPAVWPTHLTSPGSLVVAIDLRLVSKRSPRPSMVEATIVDGKALVATDFTSNAAGFVDIAIINSAMTDEVAGATLQRILEIETYRCFALLGLPIAERAASTLSAIEIELPSLMKAIDQAASLEDNRKLLERLTSMTLELEQSSALTHFRFGATRAYAELVRLRLEALAESTERGGPGLASFLSRRFDPAIRTCTTISDREANLARKLTRAAQLLRTRVEIGLQSQNLDLLQTMGNRVQLQLRLQQTVEGLSVAAIAYYVASLFHLIVAGWRWTHPPIDPEMLTACAVPPIIVGVVLAVRCLRRHHQDIEDGRHVHG